MTWQRSSSIRGTAMAEASKTLPVVVLMSFATINLAMAWNAAVAASNAANYGAGVGSVAQNDPIGPAVTAAQVRLDSIPAGYSR